MPWYAAGFCAISCALVYLLGYDRGYAAAVIKMQERFQRGIDWQVEQEEQEAFEAGEAARRAVMGRANW